MRSMGWAACGTLMVLAGLLDVVDQNTSYVSIVLAFGFLLLASVISDTARQHAGR